MADESTNINREIADQLQKQRELKRQILALGERSARLNSDERAHLKELQSEYKKLYIESRKAESERLKGFAEQQDQAKSLGSLYGDLSKLDEERIKKSIRYKGLTDQQQEAIATVASLNRDLAQTTAEDSIAKQQILLAIDAEMAKIGKVHHTQQSIVDNLQEQTNEATKLGSLTEKQKTFLQEQLDVYDGIKDTIGKILETASMLWATTEGKFGAALIGAGYAAEALGKNVREMGGYLGSATVSSTLLGTVFDDAANVTKSLSKEMGGLNDVTFRNQLNTNLMAVNMGVSGDEAAQLTGIFARLNGNSIEMAQNMAESTKQLAIQGGVAPSQVMQDIAANSEKFAEYGKDGGKNLAQAAVQAAKLGVNLDTVGKVTDSLLDFETSITKELELSAMLGRNINLNKARGLAADGQMGAAVKESIKQLGGQAAFEKMTVYQRRQAAEALGISVDELQRMSQNLNKLNDDGSMQLTTFESWNQSLSAFASGPMGGLLKTMGAMVIAAGQMTPFLKDMGINLGGMVKSTGQVLKNFVGIIAQGVKWLAMKVAGAKIDAAGGALGKAGDWLKNSKVGQAGGWLKEKLFKGVGGTSPTDATPKPTTPDAGKSTSKLTESISKIKMNDVVKGAAALVLIAGAMFILGKALQEFQGIGWETLAVAGVSLLGLTLALAGVGMIMTSGVGAVAILAGAAAMIVMAGAMWVLGKAMQEWQGVDMSVIGVAAVGLGALGLAMAGVGLLAMPIALGAIAMLGMSVALLALGGALQVFSGGVQAIGVIQPILSGLISMIGGIYGLAGAFTALSASLGLIAISGIAALPALLGLAAVGAGMGMLFGALGVGGENSGVEKGSLSEYESSMLSKMDALINEVAKTKDVYLDKEKVTAVISRTSERSSKNVFGVGAA